MLDEAISRVLRRSCAWAEVHGRLSDSAGKVSWNRSSVVGVWPML